MAEGNKLGVPDASCYCQAHILARQFYLMQKARKVACKGVVKEGLIERGHWSRHRSQTCGGREAYLEVAGHRIVQIMLRVSGWLGERVWLWEGGGEGWECLTFLVSARSLYAGELGTVSCALPPVLTCPRAALWKASCRSHPSQGTESRQLVGDEPGTGLKRLEEVERSSDFWKRWALKAMERWEAPETQQSRDLRVLE